jgi:hypothetical protein
MPPKAKPASNTLALVSLLSALLTIPLLFLVIGIAGPFVAVITGHLALARVKSFPAPQARRGLAIAGLVMGYVFIGLALIIITASLVVAGSS